MMGKYALVQRSESVASRFDLIQRLLADTRETHPIMPHFIVIEEQGPNWESGRAMRDQKGWEEHAAFMNALEAERFVILGGPLRDQSKHKALLVVSVPDEQALHARLAEDPWMQMGMLRTLEIYPWEILLGQLT